MFPDKLGKHFSRIYSAGSQGCVESIFGDVHQNIFSGVCTHWAVCGFPTKAFIQNFCVL